KTSERLSVTANFVGEYFRDKHPDHSTMRKSKECNVNEQVDRYSRKTFRKESHRHQGEADDQTKRTDDHQFFSTGLVDEQHAQHGEDKVDQSDTRRRDQRRTVGQSCHLKNPWSIIDNGVDA